MANIGKKYSGAIITLFSGFIGFCYYINLGGGADSKYYLQIFLEYYNTLDIGFLDLFVKVYNKQLGRGDYYDVTLTYLVSRLTGDHRVLFGMFGLIFGFFLSKNIGLILKFTKCPINNILNPAFILLILFFFINPPWNIFGVRFYTAIQIFVYGVLGWIMYKKYYYLLFVILTYFIHFSFALAIIVFFIYIIVGNRSYVYLTILVLGYAMQGFEAELLISKLPDFIPKYELYKIESYTNPAYVKEFLKNKGEVLWFIKYRDLMLNGLCIIGGVTIIFSKNINSYVRSLAQFGILFMGISILVSKVPSLERFFIPSQMLLIASMIILLQTKEINWLNKYYFIILITALFFIVVECRRGLEMVSIWTFVGNPLTVGFSENGRSVISFFK